MSTISPAHFSALNHPPTRRVQYTKPWMARDRHSSRTKRALLFCCRVAVVQEKNTRSVGTRARRRPNAAHSSQPGREIATQSPYIAHDVAGPHRLVTAQSQHQSQHQSQRLGLSRTSCTSADRFRDLVLPWSWWPHDPSTHPCAPSRPIWLEPQPLRRPALVDLVGRRTCAVDRSI